MSTQSKENIFVSYNERIKNGTASMVTLNEKLDKDAVLNKLSIDSSTVDEVIRQDWLTFQIGKAHTYDFSTYIVVYKTDPK